MKVLLPLDGSEPSQNTLHWVCEVFATQAVSFYLLTVIHKTIPEVVIETYQVEEALQILEQAKTLLNDRGFQVIKAEYMVGDPADAICNYASEQQVDQIIIGSHGYGGISQILLGSVSESVFKHAKQPVFIYKNKKKYHLLRH